MNSLISVAIVEDRRDIRESLAILIDGAPGFTCPLTYATAEEAVEVIPSCPPDVVLMDIDLPGINGIEAVRQLKPLCPRTQFMMCTVYDEDEPVFEALKAGANGFILKRTPPHRLLEAIAELHEGGSPMSSSIARKIVGSLQMGTPAPTSTAHALTTREREILDRLARGYTHKEVADELFVAPTTVRKHIFNIYEKLQVHSKMEAVNKYLGRS